MDTFKTKVGLAKELPITERNFLMATGKLSPYCILRDGKEHLYAVCPMCDNPIQIIGLYRDTPESGKHPYGRHNKGDIIGLAKYDEFSYINCPYSNPNWKTSRPKRRNDDPRAIQMRELLRQQYDRVIYVLEQDTGLHISQHVAEEMLMVALANEVWTYRTARENNLPWVIAEANRGRPLFGQVVHAKSDLYETIKEKCPEARLESISDSLSRIASADGRFIDLSYHFMEHSFTRSEDGEHIRETIRFRVIRGEAAKGDVILDKVIDINVNRFVKLCETPPSRARRNQKLLDIAERFLGKS